MSTPATTLEGFAPKARVAAFVQLNGVWLWTEPDVQPGYPFAMSIVDDLARHFDAPNDLVPPLEST
jgi:hypothetical protein